MKANLIVSSLAVATIMAATQSTSPSDFMRGMHAGMGRMDKAMESAPMTGDPDHDFASMMIPHHAGAIDMAKLELIHGKDPVMRRLAQEILVDQQSEIEAMQLWLDKKSAPRKEK